MAAEKSLALVVRIVEFSESSCVVTLFTRDFGKISGLAKGARRRKSPFESAIDLLSLCRLVFLHKSSDALDILTEANLERRFRAGSRDLVRLYAAYYLAELLNELTYEYDSHPELFDLANRTLIQLDGDDEVARVLLRFELHILRLLGHLPSLLVCVECGTGLVTSSGRVTFGQLAGGVICHQCKLGKHQLVSVSTEALNVLIQFADENDESWKHVAVSKRVRGEIRGLLNHYVTHLLGKPPRLHRYLGLLST